MNEKIMRSKRMKYDDLKNKDEPTACTHFVAHSALQPFFYKENVYRNIWVKIVIKIKTENWKLIVLEFDFCS